ncbi:serine racemase [Selaginella moellendorffii]|uniref:serine racemase n=1 Tax=Selaginella moellendorffii TaxID=88036 RepID=UPI000D1C9EEE|nr:serine racemase [Selaginella moellendorffii]|eukprot:XP_024543931.1 serine racemase [Selaginella moellendorffii]
MAVEDYAASLDSIQAARNRIQGQIRVTQVITSSSLDALAGRSLFFKCELFQRGGAFKIRGASNAIFSLSDEQAERGVVTHSSGNHAAAVALAAKLRGIPAHIVVPRNAPKCKVENVERYGGKISWCDPSVESREAVCASVKSKTNAVLVHPFNDPQVISGQGTVALEFLEQVPQLDVIIAPISGGGLISGISIAAKAIKPEIKIIAAEPTGADDAARSKAANSVQTNKQTCTIADGLRASLGSLTWPIVRDFVDEVVTVDDSAILEAMKMCYERLKVVVEPSGAIGLAVALSDKFRSNPAVKHCTNVGIVLSGGNCDLTGLWESLPN